MTIVIFSGFMMQVNAQTLMPLPAHSSVYSNIYTRGLWFVAPVDFTITGLMVAPEAGTGLQYIHLIKCTGTFPISTSGSTLFTTLAYISAAPNNTVQTVNIQVQQGDQIGILGTVTGISNSYGPSQVNSSTIAGQPVYLNRLGYQGSIESGPAPNYWGVVNGGSGQIGRIYMYYVTVTGTDAGVDSLIFPGDSICAGPNQLTVRLKNYGPQPLMNTSVHWSVNNVLQAPHSWTGNIPVNGTDTVTIGSYHFYTDTIYDLRMYTVDPNTYADTVNFNDTLTKTGIYVIASPEAVPDSTAFSICPGDTVNITGTLSGMPPWNLTISDGSGQINLNNITTPSFSFSVAPASTTTYTIVSITDSGGCPNTIPIDIDVNVHPNPPASIFVSGSPAACEGDSVTLMGSIGLGFIYQWYLNGNLLPSDTGYVLHAKQTGDYTVKVTSPIGCSNVSAPVSVMIHPAPVVDLGNDTVLLPNQSIMLDAGPGFNTYLWSTGAVSQTIILDSSGTGIGVKNVWVRVTDNYGCAGTDTIKINFTQHPGISRAGDEAYMQVIPNPSDGLFILHFKGYPAGEYLVEVLSQDGRTLYRSSHKSADGNEEIKLDIKHLPEGFYIIRVNGSNINESCRIAVRRL